MSSLQSAGTLLFDILLIVVYKHFGSTSIRSKGYRPEARATHVGNKSHNQELKADEQPVFTLARIPQGMQKYIDEKCLYCSSFFCFLTLHAGTGGIHRFLGFLIMLVFHSRISN